jgi:hypothetical protein
MKRIIRTPEAFEGKRIDTTKWVIPTGWRICRMTGKLLREDDLGVTFRHYLFDKSLLLANGCYVEDADWLSEEGFDLIMTKLEAAGAITSSLDYFIRCVSMAA